MEPTIYVEKFDPRTGKAFYDRHWDKRRPGNWRALMVTFPLLEAIREIKPAAIALPSELCAYDYQMIQEERDLRNTATRSVTKSGRIGIF